MESWGGRPGAFHMVSLLLCAQCATGRPVQDPCPETCLVPAHAPSHRPALRLWGPHGPGGHRFTGPDHEGSIPNLDPRIPGSHWISARREGYWPPPCPGCLGFRQPIIPVPDQGHPETDCPACLLEIPTRPRISGRMPLSVWGCLFVIGTVLEKEPRPCVGEASALPEACPQPSFIC